MGFGVWGRAGVGGGEVREETQDTGGSGAERPLGLTLPLSTGLFLCPLSPRPHTADTETLQGLDSTVSAPWPGPGVRLVSPSLPRVTFPSSLPEPDGADVEAQVPAAPMRLVALPKGGCG